MRITIGLLLLVTLALIHMVVRRAMQIDRDAPTDPNWYDIKFFKEGLQILDDEEMRSLLDASLADGQLDSGVEIRAWAFIHLFKSAPNSLHNNMARATSVSLASALEGLLERLDGHADRESIAHAVERVDSAYIAYRSYFYNLTGD